MGKLVGKGKGERKEREGRERREGSGGERRGRLGRKREGEERSRGEGRRGEGKGGEEENGERKRERGYMKGRRKGREGKGEREHWTHACYFCTSDNTVHRAAPARSSPPPFFFSNLQGDSTKLSPKLKGNLNHSSYPETVLNIDILQTNQIEHKIILTPMFFLDFLSKTVSYSY